MWSIGGVLQGSHREGVIQMARGIKHLVIVPTVLVLLLVAAAPATALQDSVTKSGTCSQGMATYSVEFKNDFGPNLEVSALVNATEANRPWHVNIRHNGKLFYSEVVTTGPGGNFQVDAHHPAKPLMPDTLVFKAFNKVTGEVCMAKATVN
jgi:hypothetical protein